VSTDNQNKKYTDFVYLSSDFSGDTSNLGAFLAVVAGVHTYRVPMGYIPTVNSVPTAAPNAVTGFVPLRMYSATGTVYSYINGEWLPISGGGTNFDIIQGVLSGNTDHVVQGVL
jgi:hypothetical protein